MMKTKLKNEEGFTLLEAVVVLFLVSLLVGFPILSVQKAEESIKVQLFIEEFSSKITLLQTHAIMNGEPTSFEVKPGSNVVNFRVYGYDRNSHPLNHRWSLPEEVNFFGGSKRIIFKAHSGNVGDYGSFRLNTVSGQYNFVFQMGSGRFDVRKIE